MNRFVHPHRIKHATKVASEKNLKILLNATFSNFFVNILIVSLQ